MQNSRSRVYGLTTVSSVTFSSISNLVHEESGQRTHQCCCRQNKNSLIFNVEPPLVVQILQFLIVFHIWDIDHHTGMFSLSDHWSRNFRWAQGLRGGSISVSQLFPIDRLQRLHCFKLNSDFYIWYQLVQDTLLYQQGEYLQTCIATCFEDDPFFSGAKKYVRISFSKDV